MKMNRWLDSSPPLELLPCPFCGCEDIKIRHFGNERIKRKVHVKCGNPHCRIERTVAALIHDFEWIEDEAASGWNRRVNK